MGRNVFAIMYAVEIDDTLSDKARDRIYNAAIDFKPSPARLADEDLLGIEVAVGGSGRRGAGDFNYTTCRLEALAQHVDIAPYYEAAVKAWPDFVSHMKKAGRLNISGGTPCLWLTTTEVA